MPYIRMHMFMDAICLLLTIVVPKLVPETYVPIRLSWKAQR
jgi:hypothetical protein